MEEKQTKYLNILYTTENLKTNLTNLDLKIKNREKKIENLSDSLEITVQENEVLLTTIKKARENTRLLRRRNEQVNDKLKLCTSEKSRLKQKVKDICTEEIKNFVSKAQEIWT